MDSEETHERSWLVVYSEKESSGFTVWTDSGVISRAIAITKVISSKSTDKQSYFVPVPNVSPRRLCFHMH